MASERASRMCACMIVTVRIGSTTPTTVLVLQQPAGGRVSLGKDRTPHKCDVFRCLPAWGW